MSAIMIETTRFLIGKSNKRLQLLLGIGIGLGLTTFAHGQAIFTTVSDFTGWTASAPATAVTASTAWDYDGSTTNGLGNNPGNSGSSINVGGTSTGGSLQITASTNLGFSELAFSPGEAYNNSFMQAFDPGSTTAFSAASSFGPGSTVAYSGTIYLVYTIPTISSGSFDQIGINLDYPADGFYQALFGSDVSDGTVNGLTTFTATIPYTVTAGAGNLSNLQLAIQSNSNEVPTSPFFVDDISFSPPVQASMPEPATLGVLGTGLSMLMLRRRRTI
jgi:hypothetical protein